jgi:putative transposase
LLERGFQISMSRKGAPWENGYVESFIKTLKAEEVSLKQYRNLEEARRSLGHFLDEVYNQHRLHSALGYLPPAQFERDWQKQNNKEAAARHFPV